MIAGRIASGKPSWITMVGAAILSSMTLPTVAEAALCDTFNGTDGDDVIMIGRAYYWNGFFWVPYGNNPLAICMISGGTTTFTVTDCDSADNGDGIHVYGGDGDDIINAVTGDVFFCAGNPMGQWYSGWDIWPYMFGDDGADLLIGAAGKDLLISGSNVANYPADGSHDWLCGYGGDDVLIGDNDDSTGDFECMDGGTHWAGGGDYCYDPDASGTEYDQGRNCETTNGVANSGFSGVCAGECPTNAPYLPAVFCTLNASEPPMYEC